MGERARPFPFIDPAPLADGDLLVVIEKKTPADPAKGHVPMYAFALTLRSTGKKIGEIRLRIGPDDALFYPGHIGYGVNKPHRGHHYAERACRLVTQIARVHGLTHLLITCDPTNTASRRTIERLGARLLGLYDIPPEQEMYREGKRRVLCYRWEIGASPLDALRRNLPDARLKPPRARDPIRPTHNQDRKRGRAIGTTRIEVPLGPPSIEERQSPRYLKMPARLEAHAR